MLTLIDRVQDLQDAADQDSAVFTNPGSHFLGQITTTSMIPTTANVIFAVNPVRISGPNGEGQTPIFTASSRTIYAANLGSQIPSLGAYVSVVGFQGRFSFIFNG